MQQNLTLPPRPPQRYWHDSAWALQNIRFLVDSKFSEEQLWRMGRTEPYEAIGDTGNSITVIPQRIHQQVFSQILYPNKVNLLGIGQGGVRGQLANVTMSFQDPQTSSPPLSAKAYLLDDNSAPLIIGYEDGLN